MVGHPQFHSFAVFVDGHRMTVKPLEKYYDRPVKSGNTVIQPVETLCLYTRA